MRKLSHETTSAIREERPSKYTPMSTESVDTQLSIYLIVSPSSMTFQAAMVDAMADTRIEPMATIDFSRQDLSFSNSTMIVPRYGASHASIRGSKA